MKKYEKEIFNKAITKWGKNAQIIVAIEECGELIQALTKFLRDPVELDNVNEEIADVGIMLDQLKLMFCNTIEVETYRDLKIQRLESNV